MLWRFRVLCVVGLILTLTVATSFGQEVDQLSDNAWRQAVDVAYNQVEESHSAAATFVLRDELAKLSPEQQLSYIYGNNGERHYALIYAAKHMLKNEPSDSAYLAYYLISEMLEDSAEGSQMLSEMIGKVFVQNMPLHLSLLAKIDDGAIVESLVADIFFVAPADTIYDYVVQHADRSASYYDAVMEYKGDADFARGLRK